MDILYPRCAGPGVHIDTVVAAVRIAAGGAVKTEVRTFDTTTSGLLTLSVWLAEQACTHIAMEATCALSPADDLHQRFGAGVAKQQLR